LCKQLQGFKFGAGEFKLLPWRRRKDFPVNFSKCPFWGREVVTEKLWQCLALGSPQTSLASSHGTV